MPLMGGEGAGEDLTRVSGPPIDTPTAWQVGRQSSARRELALHAAARNPLCGLPALLR